MQSKGFSLIELLVTVAILAILSGVALPSFYAQLQNNKIEQVEKDLRLAVGRARGIALRNEFGFFGGQAGAIVCFDKDTSKLTLHQASSSAQASCDVDVIWESTINADINIYEVTLSSVNVRTQAEFTSIAFNNQGRIICPSGSVCTNTFNIELDNTDFESGDKVVY